MTSNHPQHGDVALRKESVDRNSMGRCLYKGDVWSLSARRAWIEITLRLTPSTRMKTSLSARRAWIEIPRLRRSRSGRWVALRKESVDRNMRNVTKAINQWVALRKESVDRNLFLLHGCNHFQVALRKESVDRNQIHVPPSTGFQPSLSARRAWIEIGNLPVSCLCRSVALRKESVDRNSVMLLPIFTPPKVALRKESVDRNGYFGR